MKIELERLDEKIPLIENSAKNIVACVLSGSDELFQVFSDTLLDCSKYKAHTFLNEKIVKKIDIQKRLYPEIAEELEHLKNMMWDYFAYIEDFKLDALLKGNSDYYRNVATEQQKLNKLRGVLFEILVEEIICPRCRRWYYETGCMVTINGEKIISYYNGKPRKTIDIATYKEKKGEFYECKLSPNSLNEESYNYLNLLENKLNDEDNFESIVACVTLGPKTTLESIQTQIEFDLGIQNDNIKMYGRRELLLLKESPFEEAI